MQKFCIVSRNQLKFKADGYTVQFKASEQQVKDVTKKMESQQIDVVEVKGDNGCACPFCGTQIKYPEKAMGQSKFKTQRAMSLPGDDIFVILSGITACLEELYKEHITVSYHSFRLRCESCDMQLFRVSNKWFTKIGMKELA